MAQFKTKFESKRQDWETPNDLFLPLENEFQFTIDVCATKENAKCLEYITEQMDALSLPWHGTCWMNPPFSTIGKWIKKAYEESLRGATVVCLVPSRTNTAWWHEYVMKGEIRFLRGRPKFKGAKHGFPQPLAVVIFKP